MKHNTRAIVVILFFLIPHISCKKWLNINHDPNLPVESNTSPDQVLPSSLSITAQNLATQFLFINNWMGYLCPPAGIVDVEEQSYNITTNFRTGIFLGFYNNSNDYQFIEEKSQELDQKFYQGIAKIMKVLNFSVLVDCYNNLPYQDALKGTNGYKNSNYLYPRYEDGRLIYEELIKELDRAIQLIKGTIVGDNLRIDVADIMFKGDPVKWIKFANTLKLRLLIHQAKRPERAFYIQTEIDKLIAEGTGFLNSGENAAVNPKYIASNSKLNPYYSIYGFNASGSSEPLNRANIFAMNLLKTDSDPRLGFFYQPTASTYNSANPQPFIQPLPNNYRGNHYGLPINQSQYPYQSRNYVSKVGGISTAGAINTTSKGIIKGYDMDAWIMTSVESAFLQAEAIQRAWISGDAKAAYMNAVKESFRWLNVGGNSNNSALSDNVFTSWYNAQDAADNANVSWEDSPDKYKLIMYQKYLALNVIAPLETWTDYRRNGVYPDIPLSAHPSRTSTRIPIRLLYPLSEYENNNTNVVQQGTINQFTSKVWWMP